MAENHALKKSAALFEICRQKKEKPEQMESGIFALPFSEGLSKCADGTCAVLYARETGIRIEGKKENQFDKECRKVGENKKDSKKWKRMRLILR